jgi:hypothetical protein
MRTTKALFFELMYDFQSQRWNEFELPKLALRELLSFSRVLGAMTQAQLGDRAATQGEVGRTLHLWPEFERIFGMKHLGKELRSQYASKTSSGSRSCAA